MLVRFEQAEFFRVPELVRPEVPGEPRKPKIAMQDEELLPLLTAPESSRVERKSSLADKDKICEAICAFANDLPGSGKPGILFIGVRDNGACADLPVDDRLLRSLADLRTNGNILPFPTLEVEKRTLNGCDIVVVTVQPSSNPPVRFRGRAWIRVGPRRAIATREEERTLAERRRASDLPYELSPITTASLGNLDLNFFSREYLPSAVAEEILAQNERSTEDQLASLRFLVGGKDGTKPTVLALLTIGKDPRDFIPGAYVQFLRIAGTELTEPIKDQKEIGGSVPDQLRVLDEVLKAHVSVSGRVVGVSKETRQPDYPMDALRQLVRNAVLHRAYDGTHAPIRISWFDDRIEIQSPGGPFGQVTAENFGQPGITDYRNPNLAEVLKNLGYVQRFGLGIALAQKALAENGNPACEFLVRSNHVLVIVKRRG